MEAEQPPSYFSLKRTLLSVLVLYILYRFSGSLREAYHIRTSWRDIPSLPRHPIWGNIVNAGRRLNPKLDRHMDYGFEEIWQELGEPGCFLIDLAPVHLHGLLIVADPQHAELLTNPSEGFKYSLPKQPNTVESMIPLLGTEGLAAVNGAHWWTTRKRFNPGFQPQYVRSLTGPILSEVNIFVDHLRALANTGAVFKMTDLARDLTFDIITQVAIGSTLAAQSTPQGHGSKSRLGLITISRDLSKLVFGKGSLIGLDLFELSRRIKLFVFEYVYDYKLTAIVNRCIGSLNDSPESRSIIQLAASDVPHSKALIRNCVHQLKTFIFAGQDTTATLMSWLCYEMSKASHNQRHATFLRLLRDEHDRTFAPGAFSDLDKFQESATTASGTIALPNLPYTTAFIKETLRLHPPASTGRSAPEHAAIKLSLPTHDINIDGLHVYVNHFLIHRNPKIWGPDAHLFKPERWLDEQYVAKLPLGAYRPFERGPRNCIGQELGMLEALMVVSAVARGFTFEKIGLTGRVNADGVVEKEVWSDMAVTSVPVDGMVMRVRMTET
jgi:cytochrome P450